MPIRSGAETGSWPEPTRTRDFCASVVLHGSHRSAMAAIATIARVAFGRSMSTTPAPATARVAATARCGRSVLRARRRAGRSCTAASAAASNAAIASPSGRSQPTTSTRSCHCSSRRTGARDEAPAVAGKPAPTRSGRHRRGQARSHSNRTAWERPWPRSQRFNVLVRSPSGGSPCAASAASRAAMPGSVGKLQRRAIKRRIDAVSYGVWSTW